MIADLNPYPEYKKSGVPWVGQVPGHWSVLPNRALFAEVKDRNHPDEEMLSVTITRGIVQQKALLAGSSKKDSSRIDKSAYKFVQPGDIAYNKMRAWQGAIGASDFQGIISPAYVVMRLRQNGNLPRYFHHLYRTPQFAKEAERCSYGITSDMWSLRPEHFKMIYTPEPPPSEQAAIVRFLDWATGRLTRTIRAKRKMVSLLNEQKQAIIHRAVTRGLDPSVPLKPSGIPWLGDIPAHWEVRRAKQICSAIIDCKNRTPEMVDDGDFVVVRTTNIRQGRFNPKGSYLTDRRNFEIWTQRGAPKVGDVFFTREAPVGEACLVPDQKNLCMGQRMMYFRPNTAVLDENFLLNSIYGPVVRRYIDIEANGSTVGHLRLGQVSALPLLWCTINEQKQIIAHINTKISPLEVIISSLEREIHLLREYRTRLVADVVTGKLDVREAAARLPDEAPPEPEADEDNGLDMDLEPADEDIAI